MVLVYSDDSVRIVVSTANLVPSDWENRTQGLWVSPKCPASPEGQTPKDSVTGKSFLFLHQLAHNMTKDCLVIYQFSTYMKTISSEHVVYINCYECQNKNNLYAQHVLSLL